MQTQVHRYTTFSDQIATNIGLMEAIIIHKVTLTLDFISRTTTPESDPQFWQYGVAWMRGDEPTLENMMPYASANDIRTAVNNLVVIGIIKKRAGASRNFVWLTIDADKLQELSHEVIK